MPEVLSMLPEENSPGELNADEQESLAIGEELDAQHEGLLAGKYRTAQELESAYKELQKKLGSAENTAEVEPQEPEQEEESESTDSNFLDTLWTEASTQQYTEDTVKQLENMSSTDLANMYLDYRNQVEQKAPREMTENDVNQLKGIVGGDENYTNMMQWASQNLNEQEISMYDQVMDQGDPLAAYFAVQSLAYRYQDNVGYEGNMLQGKASQDKSLGFNSQAELVAAMSDPRYDRDPAYRQKIMQQLQNSNIDF